MHTSLKPERRGAFRGAARRARIVVAAVGIAATVGLPAAACSILPPPMPPAPLYVPGESASEYEVRAALHMDGFYALQAQRARDALREDQMRAWTRADRVAVVELVKLETDVEIPQMQMGRGARASVKPVGWLKGGGSLKKKTARAPFVLAHVSYTSCGPSPNWPVFIGKPGDRYVVFLNGEAPSQAAAQVVVAPGEIVLPELTRALAAEVRQAK